MYNELVAESVNNFKLIKTAKSKNKKIDDLLDDRENHVKLHFR